MDEAAQFFQGADFEKGLYSHSFVSATWRLGETKVQIPFDEDGNDLVFDQTVTVSTSDNGRKAISVVPMMQLKGDSMGLSYCLPLRMEHNGKSGIEEFHKMLELIDKRFDDTSLFIKQLLDIDLQYPQMSFWRCSSSSKSRGSMAHRYMKTRKSCGRSRRIPLMRCIQH